MGISRDSAHKRRLTGGRVNRIRSKRKFEMGRQPANTKVGEKKVTQVRVRGGNFKFRALRLDAGNFTWPSEAVTRKTRILKVVYNASSNELVRTNTLVKSCIVQIDSTPFKQWYSKFYNVQLGKQAKEGDDEKAKEDKPKEEEGTKKGKKATKIVVEHKVRKSARKLDKENRKAAKDAEAEGKPAPEPKTKKAETTGEPQLSEKLKAKLAKRAAKNIVEPHLADQFKTGRLYARITSRPGQVGRADGIIIEGEELAFYLRKIVQKKKK